MFSLKTKVLFMLVVLMVVGSTAKPSDAELVEDPIFIRTTPHSEYTTQPHEWNYPDNAGDWNHPDNDWNYYLTSAQ